jgi:hypothetical protein
MTLYEFTYTDNQNLPESKLLERLQDFLEKEKALQGWAPGYRLQQRRKVEHLPTGERNFYFEVLGRFLDSESISVDEDVEENQSSSSRAAAAAPDIGL